MLKFAASATGRATLAAIISMVTVCSYASTETGVSKTNGNQELTSVQVWGDSLRLTQQKVKHWIQIRIAEARLQNKMKANTADFDNLIQAFYAERQKLISQQGWTVTEYEAIQERIHAAISAMDIAADNAESRDEYEQQIAEIKANKYFSDDQKQQMINGLKKVRQQERAKFIEPTREDWQAVRPYWKTLEHMTDWIAGNRPSPPVLE